MRKSIFIASILLASKVIYAQDINLSQFYEMPLLRNPALAGIYTGDVRVTSAFRNQWSSVTVPYQTEALGAEIKLGVGQRSYDFLSLGLQVTNDVAGDSKLGKTAVMPTLTFHKSINGEKDSYLSLGVSGGAVQQRFDASKLSFNDQFVNGAYSNTNPTQQTFSATNNNYLDAAVGLMFSTENSAGVKYYAGAAYFHFTQPKVAFSPSHDVRLNKKFVMNAGMSIPTSDEDRFIMYVDYFMQGGNYQGQGGFLYKHDIFQNDLDDALSISGGLFYRWNDAVIPAIKLDYYKVGVGVSYDVNVSKLKSASHSRGGFELTMSYKNFLNIKNSSAEKVRCPVGL